MTYQPTKEELEELGVALYPEYRHEKNVYVLNTENYYWNIEWYTEKNLWFVNVIALPWMASTEDLKTLIRILTPQ